MISKDLEIVLLSVADNHVLTLTHVTVVAWRMIDLGRNNFGAKAKCYIQFFYFSSRQQAVRSAYPPNLLVISLTGAPSLR
jgi:hypothetical protein